MSVSPSKHHPAGFPVDLGIKTKPPSCDSGINDGDEMFRVFKPMVQILRLFGHCPLSFHTSTKSEKTPDYETNRYHRLIRLPVGELVDSMVRNLSFAVFQRVGGGWDREHDGFPTLEP